MRSSGGNAEIEAGVEQIPWEQLLTGLHGTCLRSDCSSLLCIAVLISSGHVDMLLSIIFDASILIFDNSLKGYTNVTCY